MIELFAVRTAEDYFAFTLLDLFSIVLWFVIARQIVIRIRDTRYKGDPCGRYMLPGLYLKIFGGVMVGFVYYFYYSERQDTLWYHQTAYGMIEAFIAEPVLTTQFLVNTYEGGKEFLDAHPAYHQEWVVVSDEDYNMPYYQNIRTFTVSKIIVIPVALGFGSYFGGATVLSFLSFLGVWALFRTFYVNFPSALRSIAIGVFFIPSVWFWGSGILKDSVTFSFLGVVTYCVYHLLIRFRFDLRLWALFLVSMLIVYSIKPYILISFIPFAVLWVGLEYRDKIQDRFIRFGFTPLLIVVTTLGGLFALTQVSAGSDRFALENVFQTAYIVQQDLTKSYYYDDGIGSSYDIGTFEPNLQGAIRIFPQAVFVTFFRPLIFEARSLQMFVASVESTVIFLLFLRVLQQTRFIGLFRYIFQHPMLLFSISYSIAFAFMVGLTSGNFGNLVRYKIPAIPFFVVPLLIANSLAQQYLRPELQEENMTASQMRARLSTT